jgi:hypothetical protein
MLAERTTIGCCATISYYRADGSCSAFVVIFIIINSIWLRLPGLTIKNPAQQQAANVVRKMQQFNDKKSFTKWTF